MTPSEYFAEHGILQSTIERFGLIGGSDKITIPVFNSEGEFLFNKYRLLGSGVDHRYEYDKGGGAVLFNSSALLGSDYAFVCEGEMDAIRLSQEGLVAVSSTSGASTFKDEWVELFTGKRVYVVYDNDPAGVAGADKVKALLSGAIVVTLPEGSGKDICEYFLTHTVADFQALVEVFKPKAVSYAHLCEVFDKWLLLPDKNVLRILMAVMISHFFDTDPVWMFFVAPPSGSKTEIINTVSDLDFTYMISDLTPQTLASGMPAKGGKDPSLLSRLKDNVILMKDFTTVLSMRFEDRLQILAQLREVYDGRYSKEFGTGKRVDWTGRLTFIAGVTSIIDTHSSVFQTMGERFIMYRIPQARDRDVVKKALHSYGKEKEMREELRDIVSRYFGSIVVPQVMDITLPEDIIDAMASLASFIVKARTGLQRDQYKKELTYIPSIEAPSRLGKQLGTLLKAFAVLEQRMEVTWEDYYMVMRIAMDIIPNNRMRHIIALCGETDLITTSEVAQKTGYSRSGAEIVLEDLVALGIAVVRRKGAGSANRWGISKEIQEYFSEILPSDNPPIYDVFPKGTEYSPFVQQCIDGKGFVISAYVPDQIDEDMELL